MSQPKIIGENQLTADQIVAWYRSTGQPDPAKVIDGKGPSLERLVRHYLEIGEKEGVRGDIAFIQAVHETGYFKNPDSDIFNFAGIAHPDGAASGMSFGSVREGVQAHIQLLKKVAEGNNTKLALPDRAPGWGGRRIEHWSQLGGGRGGWASDPSYWSKLSGIYHGLKDHARKHPGRGGDRSGGRDGGGRHGGRHGGRRDHDIRPWRIPRHGRTSKVTPERMRILAEHFTDHLAVVESVFHRCDRELDEIGRVQLAGDKLENRLRTALHEAVEDWHGLRRLPYLLTKDVGYIIEVQRRVELIDRADDRSKGYFTGRLSRADMLAMGRTADGLVAALSGQRRSQTLKCSQVLLDQLFRKDKQSGFLHRRLPVPPDRRSNLAPERRGGVRDLSDVEVSLIAWGGSKSIFDQLITKVMDRNGMEAGTTEAGQRKRHHGSPRSDHHAGNENAYAIDYPTDLSLPFAKQDAIATKAARAVAKALHIDNWQPGSYQSYVREIDGHRYEIQILWKSDKDHYDHVHIGIHRAR